MINPTKLVLTIVEPFALAHRIPDSPLYVSSDTHQLVVAQISWKLVLTWTKKCVNITPTKLNRHHFDTRLIQ